MQEFESSRSRLRALCALGGKSRDSAHRPRFALRHSCRTSPTVDSLCGMSIFCGTGGDWAASRAATAERAFFSAPFNRFVNESNTLIFIALLQFSGREPASRRCEVQPTEVSVVRREARSPSRSIAPPSLHFSRARVFCLLPLRALFPASDLTRTICCHLRRTQPSVPNRTDAIRRPSRCLADNRRSGSSGGATRRRWT